MITEVIKIMQKLGVECNQIDANDRIDMYIRNSYMQVKFIVEIEKKFGVEIPERLVVGDEISIREFADEVQLLITQ